MRSLNPSKYISTRFILFSISAMFLIHLLVLSYYTQEEKFAQHTARRSAAIQQVMNIIHMVEATPWPQLEKALAALKMPNIKVSLSTEPKWSLTANNLTFWRINRLVPRSANNIELSLQLPDKHWLNIQAKIRSPALLSQLFLLGFEAVIAFIILSFAWSVNRFTSPLKDFQVAAERLGVDLKNTVLEEYSGPQVVRETAQAMNKMQQRIKDLIDNRTQMLAAISHDLRTPITRLKLRAAKWNSEELRQKTIRDLDEMETMITEILAYARDDYSSEEKIKLDINSLLQSLCDDLTDLGYSVSYSGPNKRIPCTARKLSLQRALTNLIQNAIKYGRVARVHLHKAHKIFITIDDDGPGIPESEFEKVFAPFYRCDRSRSREIAGTGLGMAVAHDAIRAHGGTITLQNHHPHGLRVVITL